MAGPDKYRPGVSSVGQYQMSAKPFLSSSIVVSNSAVTEIKFPAVTSFLTVQNVHSGANVPLVVGFSQAGVIGDEGYKILLDNGESYTGDFRVRYIYLAGQGAPCTGSIIAGLTGIDSELSGTSGINYSGSVGIG
tara:strand:+ start:252 stop:656 length:405 start_codon:yes stop_codon:yes gene_type:complete